jgi:hypothetical protein
MLRGSKGVGVTIESYGKVEISYINVDNLAAILKMVTGRNFSMSVINSGHHYLPTYQILMISDNVEFLPSILYAVF